MENIFDEHLIKFSFEGEKAITWDLLKRFGKVYKKNQIIIKEGDASDEIYLLVKGSCYVAKTMDNAYKIMNIIHEGELFGEMAVFDEKMRSATIAAREEETVCLKFPRNDFIEIFRAHPRWCEKIIREMGVRIVKMIGEL
ncbi:MAG: cyclic nucleotide-binding domain-containing protein [bacterium]|nr:cyclic nucleotide-binding domain-containing protein [bacterium]